MKQGTVEQTATLCRWALARDVPAADKEKGPKPLGLAAETVIPGKFRRKGECGQYKCKDLAGQHNSLSPLETVQSRTKVVGDLQCFTQCERGSFLPRFTHLCSSVIRQKNRENSTVTICALTRPNP
jgi:hypothetical protein